jgi:hypothetical protein
MTWLATKRLLDAHGLSARSGHFSLAIDLGSGTVAPEADFTAPRQGRRSMCRVRRTTPGIDSGAGALAVPLPVAADEQKRSLRGTSRPDLPRKTVCALRWDNRVGKARRDRSTSASAWKLRATCPRRPCGHDTPRKASRGDSRRSRHLEIELPIHGLDLVPGPVQITRSSRPLSLL